MSERYDFEAIEKKWQRFWEETDQFRTDEGGDRPKFYMLEMLPYPSGALHMGHVRNYSLGDSIARFRKMRGDNVLHPIGWDSFGLPAENAAIKNRIPPRQWTFANIDRMRQQCRRMGWAYDWSREVTTCEPDYYRWNQWFFLQMYHRGLAYKKKGLVNWCRECQTVLANEQVVNGRCWRDDSLVEEKELEQWYWKITDYAQELLDGLDGLEDWPERVKTMQRNWIGRSEGARVRFPVEDHEFELEVFTTRLDTIFGATFMVLAPEHQLVAEWQQEDSRHGRELKAFVEEMRRQSREERIAEGGEKRGVFTGRYARNPYSGERVPIWVANFVLLEYGTGAIMAVPAHDQRDFEFARRYDLPIRVVVASEAVPEGDMDAAVEASGKLVGCGEFTGLTSEEAQRVMGEAAEKQGFGQRTVTYRLRDWGISRQRYWGTPIPMVNCPSCGTVPVPEEQLPVLLPEAEALQLGGSPLGRVPEFVNTECPVCGEAARRETDTMDTFVDSSWYFYRYTDPRNEQQPFDPAVVRYWFPVDLYIGGIEHAVLHLIYMRFFGKVMRDLGLVDHDEPVRELFTQGMVIKDGAKMSKSLGNVVSPDEVVSRYGADSVRLFIQFCAPPDGELDWSRKGLEGCFRFLRRFWRIVLAHVERAGGGGTDESDEARNLRRKLHQTIRKVTADIERVHQNTALAAIMELLNAVSVYHEGDGADRGLLQEALETMALLVSPFAPHFAEEVWERLGKPSGTAALSPWPSFDPELAREEEIQVVVQINGRVRSKFSASPEISGKEMEELALEDEKVQAHTRGKTVRKVIVVPRKLVNIVVR